jgi:hypothetical protein
MALRTDGAYHAGHAIDSLAQAVLNQENLPVRVDRRRTTLGLHRVLWPLLIVFLLLTAEWFLRKRHGLL